MDIRIIWPGNVDRIDLDLIAVYCEHEQVTVAARSKA
jgi:hypothetical protein